MLTIDVGCRPLCGVWLNGSALKGLLPQRLQSVLNAGRFHHALLRDVVADLIRRCDNAVGCDFGIVEIAVVTLLDDGAVKQCGIMEVFIAVQHNLYARAVGQRAQNRTVGRWNG